MLLAAAARSSPGGQRIIASLTIETISRGTKEMTRLTLTVQGCYWLFKIRMTVVELWWKSAGAGKHFGKKSLLLRSDQINLCRLRAKRRG
jgi:hypothetical protein